MDNYTDSLFLFFLEKNNMKEKYFSKRPLHVPDNRKYQYIVSAFIWGLNANTWEALDAKWNNFLMEL